MGNTLAEGQILSGFCSAEFQMVFERQKVDIVLVLTSEVNITVADALAKQLLNQRLAACVTLRDIKSHFWWDEKLQEEKEVQMLIKTTQNQLKKLLDVIHQLHTYQTPELLYWSASASESYGKWVEDSVCSNYK